MERVEEYSDRGQSFQFPTFDCPTPHTVSRSSTYIYYYIIVHIFSMNNSTSHSNKYLLENHLLYIFVHHNTSLHMFPAIMLWSTCSHTGKYQNTPRIMLWSNYSHRHSIYRYISQRSCSGALVHIQVYNIHSTDHALGHSFS